MKPTISEVKSVEKGADEKKTEWVSLSIAAVITFFAAIQFTVYFSSLWPYLLQLDPEITEDFFGWINAIYSLGQAIMCPGFGYLGNRMGQNKIPIVIGVMMMLVGNVIYLFCPLTSIPPKWVMFFSRACTGCGSGVIAILRNYSVTASVDSDRSRAISLNMGAFAMGLTVGPVIQLIFTPLSYPGYTLFGPFQLNMYTAPAVMGILINLICVALVVLFFRESTVGIHKRLSDEEDPTARFQALPKYDKLAIWICIATRFAMMFVITNLETIGSPLTMTMFSWNKQETVEYNSYMHMLYIFIKTFFGLAMYVMDIAWNFGKKINHRIGTIVGLLLLVVFHLLTFPWWGLPGKIEYQKEFIDVNGTLVLNHNPVGCRLSYEWCNDVPPINRYLYMISYAILCGIAFCLINVCMNTIFSKIIGPRKQGTLTGLLLLSGCVARICGPIFVSSLFRSYGPRPAWAIEIVLAGGCSLLWVIFYNRLIPLRSLDSFSSGEKFRNKYGVVHRM